MADAVQPDMNEDAPTDGQLAEIENRLAQRAALGSGELLARTSLAARIADSDAPVLLAALRDARAEVAELEADRDAQTDWPTDDGWLQDQHARYHGETGNMLGKNDCGWERCDFWAAAVWVLNAPRANPEVARLTGIVQAVETLCERWHADDRLHACANELRAALTGGTDV